MFSDISSWNTSWSSMWCSEQQRDWPSPFLIHTLHIHTAAWWMGRLTCSNKTIIPALHLCQVSFQRVHHLKRKEPITQTGDRLNTRVRTCICGFSQSAQRWRKRTFHCDEEVRGWERASRTSRQHSAGPVGWVFAGRVEIRCTYLDGCSDGRYNKIITRAEERSAGSVFMKRPLHWLRFTPQWLSQRLEHLKVQWVGFNNN